ncbi:Crp/Fnr family transcriptional regulator [Dyadobacter luteus]|uniref:Crp/Fnr family transcriptional regulator n=1 Tax=Dyadobacter luteus TaxID=2259619 RepID=A0A3D8YGI6_9BACT|nr:Crp/Fnr family transcriptional regulator [Dyadobacter luteus]REA63787.1 Crp/Fnr family transcriptional regulator [Dyadobacter luteus]
MPREFIESLMSVHPFSDAIQSDFFSRLRIAKVSKGKLLLTQRDVCDKLWYVKTGLVRGFSSTDNANRNSDDITEWFAREKNFFNCTKSFVDQIAANESIEVLEPSELIYINRNDLYELYFKYPEVCNVARLIAERYWIIYKDKLRDLRFRSAQERIEHFSVQSKDLFNRVPQKHIASYLGISENYVSKIRTKR